MAQRFLSSEEQIEESKIQNKINYIIKRSNETGVRPIQLDYLNERLYKLWTDEFAREYKIMGYPHTKRDSESHQDMRHLHTKRFRDSHQDMRHLFTKRERELQQITSHPREY